MANPLPYHSFVFPWEKTYIGPFSVLTLLDTLKCSNLQYKIYPSRTLLWKILQLKSSSSKVELSEERRHLVGKNALVLLPEALKNQFTKSRNTNINITVSWASFRENKYTNCLLNNENTLCPETSQNSIPLLNLGNWRYSS